MVITIDGPAASGKSTVAQILARELGSYYLNTGLLYRAVAYIIARRHENPDGSGCDCCMGDIKIEAQDLDFIGRIMYEYRDGKPYVMYKKEDITQHLYDAQIGDLASVISATALVRNALLPLQRDIAQKYDIVADGRDCGTVIFPDARFKFYLTASLDVRASRLLAGVRYNGVNASLDDIKQDLEIRDHRDTHREVAPLKKPDNAIFVDNSDMTIEETVAYFLRIIRE
ncbi:MAG: (d)CMP kinase [bacterium]